MIDFNDWYAAHIEGRVPMTSDTEWAIELLLEQVHLTDRELDGVKLWKMQGPTEEEAQSFIADLIERLPHPVTERGRYNQGELNKFIKLISNL